MMNIDSDLWAMNINILFLMSALVPTMMMQKINRWQMKHFAAR